ncbi:unnamed protein product [Amoebophrya sp. A25]|nr:unnamed protein product [Amoebophrya sp. A25]|eukprot:GSA25T00016053001.1
MPNFPSLAGGSILDKFRPQDVEELTATVNSARAQHMPPTLLQFFAEKQSCQQRCQENIRKQAALETEMLLLGGIYYKNTTVEGVEDKRTASRSAFIAARFERLEQQCDPLCGKRFLWMLDDPSNHAGAVKE